MNTEKAATLADITAFLGKFDERHGKSEIAFSRHVETDLSTMMQDALVWLNGLANRETDEVDRLLHSWLYRSQAGGGVEP